MLELILLFLEQQEEPQWNVRKVLLLEAQEQPLSFELFYLE
jgi:hypothetical protein